MSSKDSGYEKHLERRVRDLTRGVERPSATHLSIGLNASPSLIAKILKRIGK